MRPCWVGRLIFAVPPTDLAGGAHAVRSRLFSSLQKSYRVGASRAEKGCPSIADRAMAHYARKAAVSRCLLHRRQRRVWVKGGVAVRGAGEQAASTAAATAVRPQAMFALTCRIRILANGYLVRCRSHSTMAWISLFSNIDARRSFVRRTATSTITRAKSSARITWLGNSIRNTG
jgi:hypothetical protein